MTTGHTSFTELPLGHIRPEGWLKDQLQLQAEGQTGLLEEIWPDVGPDSAWLGGDGEDWERGPYYLDGLVPLAYVLQDSTLQAKAQKWIDAILAGQNSSGQFGPPGNDDWWPRMVALKVLTQYADATGDPRVEPFLVNYFSYQLRELPGRPLRDWGQARGADNVLSILWLHRRTGAPELRELAHLVLTQTTDWRTFLIDELEPGPARSFDHRTHGPNVAMGLKTPAVAFQLDADPRHRVDATDMFNNLDRLHGLAHGVFSGDEWLGGREPHHGVETCQVVELMFTVEQSAAAFGDGAYGDLLEQVAFNLLASANDPWMLSHQYHQQANQIEASVARRDWSYSGDDANIYGLEPHFGCCTANLHQGWPKLVRSLWMRTEDGGLAAVAYAPCVVNTDIGGRQVTLKVHTGYPFTETIDIDILLDKPDIARDFPVWLRIPQWCTAPAVAVNGQPRSGTEIHHGYLRLTGPWHTGDRITLTLPMQVRVIRRDNGGVAVRLGPLVMVHGLGENWRAVEGAPGPAEWEIRPRGSWNWGLHVDPAHGVVAWPVHRTPTSAAPFQWQSPPIQITAQGAMLPQWKPDGASTGPLPASPIAAGTPIQSMTLVPYGTARLRITEFPVVYQTP